LGETASLVFANNVRMDVSGGACISDNTAIAGSCVPYAGCTSALGCIQTVYPSWGGGTDNGYILLMTGGWALGSSSPCSVVNASFNDDSVFATDFGNISRAGNGDSLGALTYGGSCL
jgi:hypothetical protein